jgi:hypothetical protein
VQGCQLLRIWALNEMKLFALRSDPQATPDSILFLMIVLARSAIVRLRYLVTRFSSLVSRHSFLVTRYFIANCLPSVFTMHFFNNLVAAIAVLVPLATAAPPPPPPPPGQDACNRAVSRISASAVPC